MPTLGAGPGPIGSHQGLGSGFCSPSSPGPAQETARPCLLQGHDRGDQPRPHGLNSELLRPQNWVTREGKWHLSAIRWSE